MQKNAFDDVDKYCSSDKQILILDLILQYYKRAVECIKKGALLQNVVNLPVCDEILRIKMVYKNDELDKVEEIKKHLDSQLGDVERLFSR